MTGVDRPPPPLIDELRAIIVGLEHARRALGAGEALAAEDLWSRLQRCSLRIHGLDRGEQDALKPVMLAVLDELQRSIAVFGAEQEHLADKLKSASQSLAAGAAYRQAGMR